MVYQQNVTTSCDPLILSRMRLALPPFHIVNLNEDKPSFLPRFLIYYSVKHLSSLNIRGRNLLGFTILPVTQASGRQFFSFVIFISDGY